VGEAHGVTQRSLRNWKRLDPAEPPAPPGRPRTSPADLDEARTAVLEQLEAQGWSTGEQPIWRALGGRIPLARVRRVLRELKAEKRARQRRHARAHRVSTTVEAKDAVWSMDATHLGRDPDDSTIEAEVIRDVASTRTIGLSVGPPATACDVLSLLDDTACVRATYPLVLLTDNGGAYQSDAVAAWCRQHGVLHLFSLPHTPQHNGCCEHGMRELKEDALLGKGTLLHDIQDARARLEASRDRIDGHRLRRTRGWKTAVEADIEGIPWTALVQRETLYAAATCAIEASLLDSLSERARRKAVREAILDTLQCFCVITRTRDGRPWSAQCAEEVS